MGETTEKTLYSVTRRQKSHPLGGFVVPGQTTPLTGKPSSMLETVEGARVAGAVVERH